MVATVTDRMIRDDAKAREGASVPEDSCRLSYWTKKFFVDRVGDPRSFGSTVIRGDMDALTIAKELGYGEH